MKRIAYAKAAPEAFRALLGVEGYLRTSALEKSLRELVYLRVSQMNGCAYCVDMHSKDLRAGGETEERLAMVVVWRDALCFTDRERAAFAFAEAMTKLGEHGVSDEIYGHARDVFGEPLLVDLALSVATIHAWNRMGITFHAEPGHYQAAAR